jgi:5'-AMP-activated protein kinase, regulatory gamma subunit
MLTVSDLIHLIQYYYHTQTYEGAAADVEHFRLESLRGERTSGSFLP